MENQNKSNQYSNYSHYLCYSLNLYLFLQKHGLKEVDCFENPNPRHSGKMIWRFLITNELEKALMEWKDTKPQ